MKKSAYFQLVLNILGSVVSEGMIKPDPKRLKPLWELLPPKDSKNQKRVVDLFSFYSKWIKNFSTKIRPLTCKNVFPLDGIALQAFNSLKFEIENSVVCSIDESLPFQVEIDASEFALTATLTQNNRHVAFFSRMLNGSELKILRLKKRLQPL